MEKLKQAYRQWELGLGAAVLFFAPAILVMTWNYLFPSLAISFQETLGVYIFFAAICFAFHKYNVK